MTNTPSMWECAIKHRGALQQCEPYLQFFQELLGHWNLPTALIENQCLSVCCPLLKSKCCRRWVKCLEENDVSSSLNELPCSLFICQMSQKQIQEKKTQVIQWSSLLHVENMVNRGKMNNHSHDHDHVHGILMPFLSALTRQGKPTAWNFKAHYVRFSSI